MHQEMDENSFQGWLTCMIWILRVVCRWWAVHQLTDYSRDTAVQWGQNTKKSSWPSLGSKMSYRLIPQNSTAFMKAISTSLDVTLSQCSAASAQLMYGKYQETVTTKASPCRESGYMPAFEHNSERCLHRAPDKAIIVTIFSNFLVGLPCPVFVTAKVSRRARGSVRILTRGLN